MGTGEPQAVEDAWGWVTQKRKLRRGLRAEWGAWSCPEGARRTQELGGNLLRAQIRGDQEDPAPACAALCWGWEPAREPGFLTPRAWAHHSHSAKLLKIKKTRLGKSL